MVGVCLCYFDLYSAKGERHDDDDDDDNNNDDGGEGEEDEEEEKDDEDDDDDEEEEEEDEEVDNQPRRYTIQEITISMFKFTSTVKMSLYYK